MTKIGILADYDLMANAESSARNHDQPCVGCGVERMTFQWSDYSGEAMCTRCGTPYQIKWGSKEQEAEGKYPYLNLYDDAVPLVREYYAETGQFTYLGTSWGGPRPGLREFNAWVKERHPEYIEKRKAEREARERAEATTEQNAE